MINEIITKCVLKKNDKGYKVWTIIRNDEYPTIINVPTVCGVPNADHYEVGDEYITTLRIKR